MPLTPNALQIARDIMSFTPEQYTSVIKNLTPEELNHLDRILEKYLDEYLQEDVESQ